LKIDVKKPPGGGLTNGLYRVILLMRAVTETVRPKVKIISKEITASLGRGGYFFLSSSSLSFNTKTANAIINANAS
jgi:hypothetical protein